MNDNAVKSFDILGTSLNILHNYFDGLTKLFSDLYPIKFLDILLVKPLYHVCFDNLIWTHM